MTEEKICPFMSKPAIVVDTLSDGSNLYKQGYVECIKERCMAWGNTAAYDKTGKKTEPNPGCRLIP